VTHLIEMSHLSEISKMSIIHSFKDHSFGLKMTPNTTFLFDKVITDCVATLWKLLIREKHIKSLFTRLDGMKCE